MAIFKVKGNEFEVKFAVTSLPRYALLFQNNIINSLRKLGVPSHHIKMKEELLPFKSAGAEVFWYLDGQNCYYSYNREKRYIDNLQIISKVIEIEVLKILDKEKTLEEFKIDFREEDDLIDKRKEARATLGLDENENNLDVINKQFKTMAKELHPDAGGDAIKFKEINEAHKLLKKELE